MVGRPGLEPGTNRLYPAQGCPPGGQVFRIKPVAWARRSDHALRVSTHAALRRIPINRNDIDIEVPKEI